MTTQAAEPSAPRRLTSRSAARSTPSLTGRLTEVARGYQNILARDPHQPQALVGMSLVALASRQPDAAVRMAAAAVAAAPAMLPGWIALGQALKAAGQTEAAERAFAQAIRLDGLDPLARTGLGELMLATGRADEAQRQFELALRRRPTLITAIRGLGNAFAFLGKHEEALARYEQALAIHPRLPEAEFAAGFALMRLGKPKEAEIRYRRALVRRPDFAAAWINLGSLLREQGRDLHAQAALRRAVELRPDLISGWVNLSLLERDRRHFKEAEDHLRTAFNLNPDQVETLVGWCQLRLALDDRAGAWEWLRRALAVDPDYNEAQNMRGVLLHTGGDYEGAVAAFERAEALGNRAAASNRGNSLLDLGRMDETLRAHERAVEQDPEGPGARYNLALTQLRLGDWRRGWPNYEARWRFREVHRRPRRFAQPRWQGEPLEGRCVLLHAEQGLGDTIQFCRYAALVAARGGRVILQVQEPVRRLLESLAVVRSGEAALAVLGGDTPGFDLECPLMSLPAVFGTIVETVPWPGPYLAADPTLAAARRSLLTAGRAGPRIGIAWAGNPRYKSDHLRSTRLETLLALMRAVPAVWVSLQKGEAAGQLADLPGDVDVWDGSSTDRNLAETAALMSTLDLVVTTDTSIAHLAGALGKPVWILLPHLADWRWMQGIETTPWYPTARLLRQSAAGDWSGLMTRVAEALGSPLTLKTPASNGASVTN